MEKTVLHYKRPAISKSFFGEDSKLHFEKHASEKISDHPWKAGVFLFLIMYGLQFCGFFLGVSLFRTLTVFPALGGLASGLFFFAYYFRILWKGVPEEHYAKKQTAIIRFSFAFFLTSGLTLIILALIFRPTN